MSVRENVKHGPARVSGNAAAVAVRIDGATSPKPGSIVMSAAQAVQLYTALGEWFAPDERVAAARGWAVHACGAVGVSPEDPQRFLRMANVFIADRLEGVAA